MGLFNSPWKDAYEQKRDELIELQKEHDEEITKLNQKLSRFDTEEDSLRAKISELKGEVADLKQTKDAEIRDMEHKRKVELEDIQHLTKMLTEKKEVEFDKKVVELEREKQEAIAQTKDRYRDKMEKQLSKETENIKDMYEKILERLPNVNMRIQDKTQKFES